MIKFESNSNIRHAQLFSKEIRKMAADHLIENLFL